MIITDKTKIKNITPNKPELVSNDYKNVVLEKFNAIRTLKEEIYSLYEKINYLEEQLKRHQEGFRLIEELFTIEYDTKEVEDISESCNLGIVNSTDYRNQH